MDTNYLIPPEPDWLSVTIPRARALLYPSVYIDVEYMGKQARKLGAGMEEARAFKRRYARLIRNCGEDALLATFFLVHACYENTMTTTMPLLATHGSRKDFIAAVCYFAAFNHFRRHLYLWNFTLSIHYQPFLHLAFSHAATSATATASPHSPLRPPALAFSTLTGHLHIIITVLDCLNAAVYDSFFDIPKPNQAWVSRLVVF